MECGTPDQPSCHLAWLQLESHDVLSNIGALCGSPVGINYEIKNWDFKECVNTTVHAKYCPLPTKRIEGQINGEAKFCEKGNQVIDIKYIASTYTIKINQH